MADSTQVINHLVRTLGVSAHDATAFVEVIQEIVEEQVTDDVSVIAPPLIVGRFGCPVLDRLMMRLQDPRWSLPESVDIAPAELADLLRLPVEVVEAYPVVGRFGLLAKCPRPARGRRRGRRALPADARHLAHDVRRPDRRARLRGAAHRAAARPSAAGCSTASRCSAASATPRASPTSSTTASTACAHSFDDGHRPDLVARITDDGDLVRRGDWLVVQHKTTAVGHNAHDELATHVDWLRAELGRPPRRRAGARPADRRRRQPAARAGPARAGVRLPVALGHRLPALGPFSTPGWPSPATPTPPRSPTRRRCGWARSSPPPAESAVEQARHGAVSRQTQRAIWANSTSRCAERFAQTAGHTWSPPDQGVRKVTPHAEDARRLLCALTVVLALPAAATAVRGARQARPATARTAPSSGSGRPSCCARGRSRCPRRRSPTRCAGSTSGSASPTVPAGFPTNDVYYRDQVAWKRIEPTPGRLRLLLLRPGHRPGPRARRPLRLPGDGVVPGLLARRHARLAAAPARHRHPGLGRRGVPRRLGAADGRARQAVRRRAGARLGRRRWLRRLGRVAQQPPGRGDLRRRTPSG